MGGSYFAIPASNRKYHSVYPIDDSISDKVPEFSQTLALSSRMGGGKSESYEEPIKFPLKGLKSQSIVRTSLILSTRSN